MNQIIDPLSIIHFLQYFIFGIFFKNKFILVIILSFAWEIFEYYFTRNIIIKDFLIKYWAIPQKYWEEKNIINRILYQKFY